MSRRTPDFYIGSGDELADLPVTFVDAAGDPVDITGAAVRCVIRSRWSSIALLDEAATIVSAPNGTAKYEWQAGDTDSLVEGDNWAQFHATVAGERFTAPNDGALLLHVQKVIA